MAMTRKTGAPDRWGQRVVFLSNGVPVRRVPASLSRRFFQICTAVAAEVAAEEDLTTLQFAVLTYLYEEPDIDQNGLAARLGVDRSNTSLLIDELEGKGLVERRVNGADRRSRLLRLTAAGKRVRDRLRPKAGVAQARILAPLAPAEREQLLDMLVRIIDANEVYARPGAGRRKPGSRPSPSNKNVRYVMSRMKRSTQAIAATLLFLAAASAHGDVVAQPSEMDKVRAANEAYYAALSARDMRAMEQVWSRTPDDTNIAPPVRPAAHVGWDAVRKNYEAFWGTLDELTVSMEKPTITIKGQVAWVHGFENAQRRTKSGQASGGSNFGTSIFVNQGGRWLMVFHQAAFIPPPR